MFMTIAKHKRLTEETLDTEIRRNKALSNDVLDLSNLLSEANATIKRLQDHNVTQAGKICQMLPDYTAGKAHRERAEKYNAERRARNAK